jgi:hypothetical protein
MKRKDKDDWPCSSCPESYNSGKTEAHGYSVAFASTGTVKTASQLI